MGPGLLPFTGPALVDGGIQKESTPAERRASMTWAQHRKRVFGIDIKICWACGGAVKVIAYIENPAIIKKILTHLEQNAPSASAMQLPQGRAPPGAGWFN